MARVGGKTTKFYRETRGVKVAGGQKVNAGAILTRQGDRWKPGRNVNGRMHLTAACAGEVYFTRKKGHYHKMQTFIHIKPLSETKTKKAE